MFKTKVLIQAAITLAASLALPAIASEYTFTITNNSSQAIREVWVSEDGEDWGYFDLDGTSIPAKGSLELEWDESTNSAGCFWWIQVEFSDGSESQATQFDFCDNPDLVLN